MKKCFLAIAALFLTLSSYADKGMWLPSLIEKGTIKQMQARGLKLSAKDLYNDNGPSLKDAIVKFGNGCTGEMISDQGLLLTNHHCGYGQIQAHSTLAADYITDGFAAMNRAQELPNPGLTVTFLVSMADVTARVAAGDSIKVIEREAVSGTHYKAKVEPLYNGGEYYLYIYEIFEDVRLVFAPPSAIGKFGGDTDNWIWPRHTGDFSIFRVYADKNGKPAKYSADNVPYKPKKFFTISSRGINEGDYTMVYGYPGKTQQFLHSDAVEYIVEKSNPTKIALRDLRLGVMNRYAASSDEIRIKYAAKNAGVANAWKKWQGEKLGLQRLKTVATKRVAEAAFETWAAGGKYEGLTYKLRNVYDSIEQWAWAKDIYNEGVLGSEILKYLATDTAKRDSVAFFKDYVPALDNEITALLFEQVAQKLPADLLPVGFSAASQPNEELADAFSEILEKTINPAYNYYSKQLDSLYTIYIMALREMEPKRNFYPDANMTLRIAYGVVAGYEPSDGVYFKPITTVAGIMEKDRPEIYDYNVPTRLREIAPANADVAVAFLATNHTSGGNSGSPVLNAKGELIGINFDRVWQGTMSDIEFDEAVCRNISLDIRFVLFIIDKYAGAGYLINEMKIVK